MMTWLTPALFIALTAFFAWQHVRRTNSSAPAAARATACPRCKGVVPPAVTHCPHCQAPLQAFELALARVVTDQPVADGPLHAMVRADVCVGCGTCVDACPEPGAIAMVNKLAVVNRDLCKGHGECVQACPVNGILLTSGEAVQRIEVPEIDINFESNVPGLYVVGELGGRGLIKNAINEGKLAVEHVASVLRSEASVGGAYDVIIVGSGPAGLSAGLEALSRGLRYLILEQGSLSDTISKYPRRKALFAEPIQVPLYGDLWVADASKESLLKVWTDVIEKTGLVVTTGQRVERLRPAEGLWFVSTPGAEFRGKRVILALGRRGTPRRLGVPGEELEKVLYDIAEMEAFAGLRLLVVGGGDSAIESALGLANQVGTTVTLSYRGTDFTRAKERNREKLQAAIAAGRIEALLSSEVREIRPDMVVLEHDGCLRLVPNDGVVIRIGGEAPYPFLERLGVRIVTKEVALPTLSKSDVG